MPNHDLCVQALKLHPELWHATQLVDRVFGKEAFPITGIEDLISKLRDTDENHCKLDGVTLTDEHARQYFPTVFFPIENESDLLHSLFAALCWGTAMHHVEALYNRHRELVSGNYDNKGAA